jgi:hypothetical protein
MNGAECNNCGMTNGLCECDSDTTKVESRQEHTERKHKELGHKVHMQEQDTSQQDKPPEEETSQGLPDINELLFIVLANQLVMLETILLRTQVGIVPMPEAQEWAKQVTSMKMMTNLLLDRMRL